MTNCAVCKKTAKILGKNKKGFSVHIYNGLPICNKCYAKRKAELA